MSKERSWAAARQLLLRLHFYAGILIAPFLLVAAVSGMLYAASYQVEDAIYRDLRTVEASGGEPLTLNKQVQAVAGAYPEATVTGVRTGAGPEDSTQVLLAGPVRESGAVPVVFVDPYTGEVLGDSTSYGSSQAGPFREWATSLHRHLHLGEPGRVYSELAASWLWVVALGGVALWLSRRRRPGGLLWPRRPRREGRAGSLSWHAPLGMWLVLVLLFLSVTGVTWSRFAGENVASLRETLGWQTPTLSADAGEHAAHEGHAGHHDHGASAFDLTLLDGVHDAAVDAGFEGPLEITLPTGESGEFLVAETQRSYPVQQDTAVIATASGEPEVAEELRFEDWPFMAQATNVLIAAHRGILFGLANQVVLFASMAALVALIVLGYRMWWQRRAKDAVVGRPYPPGSLRRLPWP
ncbi:PepSY-associated TM helix domain-containing protein, partial [Glycomyces tenuis]